MARRVTLRLVIRCCRSVVTLPATWMVGGSPAQEVADVTSSAVPALFHETDIGSESSPTKSAPPVAARRTLRKANIAHRPLRSETRRPL